MASGNHVIGFDPENDLLTVWDTGSGEVVCDMHADENISSCTVSSNKVFCGTVNGNIYVMIPENFSLHTEPVSKAEAQENTAGKHKRSLFAKWFRK